MSDQGRCSCVQDISVTLCDEIIIMFWEVSGIGTEVIGLLWNFTIFGTLHQVILSQVIPFLDCTLLVTPLVFLLLFYVSCFLTLVSESGS